MSGPAAAPEARAFHTLDALRGIAAVGVVVFHMQQAFAPFAAPGGYLAVDLFFMMSGVVLSHAYESRFQAGMGTLGFMRVRLIRLYPLYFVGTLLGIAVTLASFHGRNSQHWDPVSLAWVVLLALLFLPNPSVRPVNQLFPLNIPCWSLFLEVLVNLLFVMLWPWLSSRRLVILSLVTGGTVALAIARYGSLDQGSVLAGLPVGLVRTVFGFAVGVLIARHLRTLTRPARRKSNVGVAAILAVVVVAITGWPQGDTRALWDATCVFAVFPLLVYCGTRVDPGPVLLRIATFLGVTSYAVYVLHSPLSAVLNSVARNLAGDAGVAAGAPYLGGAVLVLLLGGCWLVDRYVDMPVRGLLSRIVPRAPALRTG